MCYRKQHIPHSFIPLQLPGNNALASYDVLITQSNHLKVSCYLSFRESCPEVFV